MKRLGKQQHTWMYGGPNCWDSEPYRFLTSTGAPPATLKTLVQRGWMWANRIETLGWMPRKQEWLAQPSPSYLCGLTKRGRAIIEEIKNAHVPQHQTNTQEGPQA